MKVLLATRNTHKLEELRRILTPLVPDAEVIGLADVDEYPETPENGATFADNALIKARDGVAHAGLITVADDSGIAVDALNGMPGVLSARWAGHAKDDAANNALLLDQLDDVPDDRRGAAFVCAAVVVAPDGTTHIAEGLMPGRVIREERGANGFGYDPLFVPDGHEQTTAELAPADKDAISHRGQALRALVEMLVPLLRG